MSDSQLTPNHVGIILDGNRRWARERGLPTLEGHRKGYDNLKTIAEYAFKKGVKFVSAYIFSTENWSRAKEEVDYLMQLVLLIAVKDAKELIKQNVKIVIMGVEDRVPKRVMQALKNAEEDSRENTGGILALCFNYGGKSEITDAVKKIIQNGTLAGDVTQELISQNLYHPEVPAVDLMIRTSGEQRLSNFMLWRVAYAELYFTDVHWPRFDKAEFDTALESYKKRNRRFGGK